MTLENFGLCGREPIRKNRARTFNEILAAEHPDLAARILPAVLPTQNEIDEMVRKAWAKAEPREPISKALPVLRTLDPVEGLIAKAETGAAHPAEIDAVTDEYVRKAMTTEDRNIQQTYARLAAIGDKELNRLYGARQLAAVTFRKIGVPALPVSRNAADRDRLAVTNIEERVEAMARELCRLEFGLTMEAARARVWNDNPELYSAYKNAKATR